MLKKNLLMLSVSVMFGVALVAPSAALAQSRSSALLRVRRQPSLVPLLVSAPVARLRVWAAAVSLRLVLWVHRRVISQVLYLISPV